ncbi:MULTISPECIES: malonate--CoA ligase [Rhodobacterales]|jgi:malonyl-CoA/methylmalonyl-CoA synthetase|uniref:malonate--CoA ligase n=1 Tax=Rhodobacterales TaxID=204455 RepID=UPI00237EF98F|nr:malonyl-CoA synthase [Phaeobacter gallaeciensis]MDE4141610.1 malonyl-CoA synthase [Phaeobacter gallaeciensis]MDE4150055.1 malonyl-CoA synthase [Phaeobacter gallaeciensis]MDE4154281.1 malonyl-CoA synthase [Phaeobacter gallaeciensis]MDE4229550.1 malonyl-CoA synthase [Phaeobacter gallaeciensis]MDE4258747.1 malonyl-CoA synthase [Phaeobacter gallaeciensis]
MYDANHLISRLRAASIGHETRNFATFPARASMTFGELFAGAERNAAALVAMGVQPGDRVAVQVEKTIEAIQLYLGTVMAGGVFLPLNTAYTTPEVAYFLGDASPRVVVCDPAREDDIAEIAGDARVVTLDGKGLGSLTDAVVGRGGFDPVPRGPDDLAAILYTSGTTGRSKGAMLSHENLASNSLMLRDYWQFTEQDVLIHALPIFHTHGLFVATNVALLAGARLVFLKGFNADEILDAMPRATALMGVPTFYTRLLADPRLTRERAENMRLFISGSAPLLVDTHEEWEARTGHRILERYGMTETNMSTSNPYDGERRAGTVGFPLPGVEARIMAEGKEVPTGETGVLQVRGANVFQGYWQMPEKTAEELLPDGWFITGDMARMDEDGYVTIVGRAKDLVITGGFNVYPKEVESLIDDLPGVLESAVIGVPHPDFGEAVVAVVVPTGEGTSPEAVKAALSGHLAKFKQPKEVILLDALPRNTMGKVQKKALREDYAGLFA